MTDAERLRQVLRGVEIEARGLRWAEERPWRARTHVWTEDVVAVVDLHDLNARLARTAADQILHEAAALEAGAVLLVVGVGRRSAGPPVLQGVVVKALAAGPYKVRMAAPGRVALILDPARAPALATGGSGGGMTLWWLFVAAAAAFALVRGCLS